MKCSMIIKQVVVLSACLLASRILLAQHTNHDHAAGARVEAQPLLAQAIRLQEALAFLGSELSAEDVKRLQTLQHEAPGKETAKVIQEILDPYCLAIVSINPEARVKVARGEAPAKLIQGGWTSFLVKIHNDANVTAQLEVESPNSVAAVHAPSRHPKVMENDVITPGQAANRFLEMQVYRNRPLLPNLSGLGLEYAVVQIYSKDAGQREAEIGFNIGQGTQDIGFRNTINILFDIRPSVKVTLQVKDDDGSPAMASFLMALSASATTAPPIYSKLIFIWPLPGANSLSRRFLKN